MGKRVFKKYARVSASLGLTLFLVALLLALPTGVALSLTATITTDKEQAQQTPTYKLGEPIVFPITLQFNEAEQVPDSVSIEVQGATPFSPISIPLVEGTQDLTNQLPADFFKPDGSYNDITVPGNESNVSLVAQVAFVNIDLNVGYGYGYLGGSGGGSIDITVTYKPPILTFPVPPAPAGPIENPTFRFVIPGGGPGGPGGPGDGPPPFPDFDIIGDVPGVPNTPFDAMVLGASFGNELVVVVDGFPGQNDVVGRIDPTNGFFNGSFQIPNIGGYPTDEIQGVTVLSYSGVVDVVVVGGTSGADAFLARFDLNGGLQGSVVDLSGVLSNRPGGLAVDSFNNVYVAEFQSDPSQSVTIVTVDPFAGTVLGSFTVPLGPVGKPGFEALVYNPDTDTFLGTAYTQNDAAILEFDSNGAFVSLVFPTSGGGSIPDNLTGLGLVSMDDVLFAVADVRIIYASTVSGPAGPISGFSNFPTFITKDSATEEIFIGVDGEPNDGIRVTDATGVELRMLTTPSNWIEAGVIVQGELFVADNATFPVSISKLDLSNGDVLATLSLPSFVGPIGGLAYDGTQLIGYEQFNDVFHKIDKDTGNVVASLSVFDANFGDPFYQPFGAEAAEVVTLPEGQMLLIGRFNQVFEIDLESGALEDGYFTPLFEIRGLGQGSLLLADGGQQSVYEASLPGEAQTDPTTAGTYTALVASSPAPTNPASEQETTFTLETVDTLVVTITSPADASGVTSDDLDAEGKIVVQGTVNDPTVKQVSFGAVLPTTTLLGAPVDAPTGPLDLETQAQQDAVQTSATSDPADWEVSGLWHVTTDVTAPGGKKYNGTAGFYYGIDNLNKSSYPTSPIYTYNTGFGPSGINSGNLDSPTFTVGEGTVLTFNTWQLTEPMFDYDHKLIQFCSGSTCTTIAQMVDFPPMPQPGQPPPQPGLVFDPAQVGANFPPFNDGRKFIFMPSDTFDPFTGQPMMFPVSLELNLSLGTGFLRLRFDTVDEFVNDMEGWYVDDIVVTGTGAAAGITFPVVNGQWQGSFAPTEGKNDITVNAIRSAYTPVLTDSDTVSVFLDSQTPVVSFDEPSLTKTTSGSTDVFVTNTAFQTLTGSLSELSPDLIQIYQLSDASLSSLLSKDVFTDSSSKLILTEKSFDEADPTFSKGVTLVEGYNKFGVKLTDKGGLVGTDEIVLLLDTTAPTGIAQVVTITSDGEAVVGDDFFLIVSASDAASGVASVEDLNASQSLVPIADVPLILRKMHLLDTVTAGAGGTTTHASLNTVASGTPVGTNTIPVTITDNAGNQAVVNASINVVSSRSNRNFFLGPGFNFIGLALIPDDTSIATTMSQQVPNTSAAFAATITGTPTLSDVVEAIFAFPGGDSSTPFLSFTPGGSADSLTLLAPFQGMVVKTKSTVNSVEVFDKVPVAGFTADQAVFIKLNIQGVFFEVGSVPPSKSLVTGYNLVAPHILGDTLFENVFRGALIPDELAVSAITFKRSVSPTTTTSGGIGVEIVEGFETNGKSDNLSPELSYWTFIVSGTPTITP